MSPASYLTAPPRVAVRSVATAPNRRAPAVWRGMPGMGIWPRSEVPRMRSALGNPQRALPSPAEGTTHEVDEPPRPDPCGAPDRVRDRPGHRVGRLQHLEAPARKLARS